jgi:hypothetical protein
VFSGIEKVVNTIDSIPKVEWDFEGIHYFDNGPLTVQYLFVLDAMNFCFWPGLFFFLLILIYGANGPLFLHIFRSCSIFCNEFEFIVAAFAWLL